MTTASEPAWLRHARSLLGTREALGAANSPTIMAWAKRLGTKVLGMFYNADSVPWCGLFVAHCFAEDGIPAAPIAVRANGLGPLPAFSAAEVLMHADDHEGAVELVDVDLALPAAAAMH